MKRGFTLVELSIVLVIIGLLIGGILVAQSMIETAKIQNFVRQVQQFDIAVTNFTTKYKGLPGDTTTMGCLLYNSNACDNGLIEDVDGDESPYLNGEIGRFWSDLSNSGLKSSTGAPYPDCSAGCDYNYGVNVPQTPFGISGFTICPGCGYAGAQGLNLYMIFPFTGGQGAWAAFNVSATNTFTPAQALAIDLKLDDGTVAGNVIPFYQDGSTAGQDDGLCVANGAYNVSDSASDCNLEIVIDSSGIGTQ